MKKTTAQLIDELSITNCKIFSLVDKVQQDKHSREDASKLQKLNGYRSQLVNALNDEFGEKKDIKV